MRLRKVRAGRRGAPRTRDRGSGRRRASDEVELWWRRHGRTGQGTTKVSSRWRAPRRHGRRLRGIVEWTIDGAEGQLPRKARTRDAKAYEANLLDETNLRILGELREDGRLDSPSSDAGSACRRQRSPSACAAVGARGRDQGYHAELDPAALGFPAAVVRIRPSPGQLQRTPRSPERHSRSASVTGSHRRGLLSAPHPPAVDRRSGGDPRPLHASRSHDDVDHPPTPVPRRGAPLSG